MPKTTTQQKKKKIKKKYFFQIYAAAFLIIFFNVFYRIKKIDNHNVPIRGPFIIMGNHVSHLDVFVMAYGAFPRFIAPFFGPADARLWKSKIFGVILSGINSIPIFKGSKDDAVVNYMIEIVRSGHQLLFFPEGARKKPPYNGKVEEGKLGTGWIAHTLPNIPIIPCAIKNTEIAMPAWKGLTLGGGLRKIEFIVKYGKPVDLHEFKTRPSNRETSEKVTKKIINTIQELYDSI